MLKIFSIFPTGLLFYSQETIAAVATDQISATKSLFKYKRTFTKTAFSFVSSLVFFISTASITQADTLGQRAIYTVKILEGGDAAEVGQCSAFGFGDVSLICGTTPGPLEDNVSVAVPFASPALSGGDGVIDGFAGTFTIETGRADASGNNTFTLDVFQMDPYLGTPGGVFKTTMTPPDGELLGSGTVSAVGDMTLDVSGRTGVAAFFEVSIGIQPWNVDDSATIAGNGDPTTSLWVPFTTGSSSSFDSIIPGAAAFTLTGRPIGDANTDGILDAVMVSAGNIGQAWTGFDGVPYSEAFNVQFVLVSADPVAVDDMVATTQGTPVIIDINNDLIINDSHAAGEALTLDSFTPPVDAVSTLVLTGGETTLTYTPNGALTAALAADSFTYTISDADGQTDTATAFINIGSGTPPTVNNDTVPATEDIAVTFDPVNGAEPGVATDFDADGDTLALCTVCPIPFDAFTANAGTVVSAGGDMLTYTPPTSFNGADTFDYTIHDGNGNTATGTVTVNVAPVNNAPVCTDVSFTTAIDTALDIDVTNDLLSTISAPPLCTDVEGDAVSLAAAGFDPLGTSGGTISSDGAGTLTYTPPAGFEGIDTFTFTATDGVDDAAPNTVTVNVANPNLSNFTMLDQQGNTFGGTNDVLFEWDGTSLNTDDTDTTTNATMASQGPHPFFGSPWFAHHIRMFGPGTYTFDTTCNKADFDAGITSCNRELTKDANGNVIQTQQFLTVTVGTGQVGSLVFFDYTTTEDIDVFLVWDLNAPWDTLGATAPKNQLHTLEAGLPPDVTTDWEMVSTDGDGDGIVGVAMIDGSFIGFSANFNIGPGGTADALPPITGETSDTSLGGSALSGWSILVSLFSLFGLRRLRKNK